MRVVALTTHPEESPGSRYRLVQYTDELNRLGIQLKVWPFFSPTEFQALYRRGLTTRAKAVWHGYRRRRRQISSLSDTDAVIVYRELAPFFNRLLLGSLKSTGIPYLFDLDDAVYLPVEGGTSWLRPLRQERKDTKAIVRGARVVLAGNRWLAEFARHEGAKRVQIVPTVVDADRLQPSAARAAQGVVRISWVGTHTTQPYLELVRSALEEVASQREFCFEVVSSRPPNRLGSVPVKATRWRLADETSYFANADIGLYPLPDSDWSRGKCGLKAIQYMAAGVPVVASPVGVVAEMVQHGETGFHARTHDEWVSGILRLVDSAEQRERMGAAGRAFVEGRYTIPIGARLLAEELRKSVQSVY